MFNMQTKKDLQEAAAIENRRRIEQERRGRIFNARNRTIGMDYAELDRQVAEKKRAKEIEQEHERNYLNEEKRRTNMIVEKSRAIEEERRHIAQETNEFRLNVQKKELSRDFDLIDPNGLKNDAFSEAAAGDNRHLGLSSAQKFYGEDETHAERQKAQKDQQRSWLYQQMTEQKQRQDEQASADKYLEQSMFARDHRASELETAVRSERRRLHGTIANFNKQLAAEQEAKRRRDREQEEQDNWAEIYNNVTSDMLSENVDCAASNLGPTKKIGALYRGMGAKELDEFRAEQRKQLVDQEQSRNEKKMLEDQWAAMTENLTNCSLASAHKSEDQRRAARVEVQQENFRLAEEQKNRNNFMNRTVFLNKVSPDFYDQFNTSSR